MRCFEKLEMCGYRRSMFAALCLATVLGAGRVAGAAVIYVDATAPTGGNGQSWQSAFKSPHQALSIAQPGDEIRIAKGIYRPAGTNGSRTRSFKLKEGVTVQGGYAGLTQPNPNLLNPAQFFTRLSGDLNKNDANSAPGSSAWSDNSFHVVVGMNITRETKLRGLIVSNGNANGPASDPDMERGGGVLCLGGTGPTIENCIIEKNFADLQGAGLYSDGNPLFKFCTVRKNKVYGHGAGIWVQKATVRNSTFSQNTGSIAHTTGAILGSKVTIANCTFKQNASGGVMCGDKSFIRNCLFEDNFAEDGGGVYAFDGIVDVLECDFESNGATSFGGAVYTGLQSDVTLINCRFAGNSAEAGSAIYNRADMLAVNCSVTGNKRPYGAFSTIHHRFGTMTLVNCTVAHNTNINQPSAAIRTQDDGALNLHNCIIWGNDSDGVRSENTQVLATSNLAVLNCCIEGWTGALGGQNNFDLNPLFANALGADGVIGTLDDNVRLSAESPCVNAGAATLLPGDDFDLDNDDNLTEPISLDLDGEPRIVGPSVDCGAFEFF